MTSIFLMLSGLSLYFSLPNGTGMWDDSKISLMDVPEVRLLVACVNKKPNQPPKDWNKNITYLAVLPDNSGLVQGRKLQCWPEDDHVSTAY